jgi:8-oxo-dGTP pyrophosphatase MutT (NUDIX family)
MQTTNPNKTLVCTVVYLVKPAERLVWLGFKLKKVGAGRWNGPGGKLEEGETIRMCAVNETRQESGVVILPEDLKKAGIVDFFNGEFDDVPSYRVHFFTADRFVGEPRVMEPDKIESWTPFPFDSLPELQAGDRLFVSAMLDGKKFEGWVRYKDKNTDAVVSHSLTEVETVREDE